MRYAKKIDGETIVLGRKIMLDGVIYGEETQEYAQYAAQNGFQVYDEADLPSDDPLVGIEAENVKDMPVRQRTQVLSKIVAHLKKGFAIGALFFIPFICGAAELLWSQLGDLIDESPVVTNVVGFEETEQAVLAWSSYWGGDDFRVTVTNYPVKAGDRLSPSGKKPTLSMAWKTTDDNGVEYMQEVWNEQWRWDWLLEDYLPENIYNKAEINTMLEDKADRAWGFYDSHTGLYSPEGYTQISSPHILVSAGMSYQQTVTTEGSVWVLTSNGTTTQLGGDAERGYFRVSDAEGNTAFEVVKGNKRTVGAIAGGVTTLPTAPTTLKITYNVESAEAPKMFVSRKLGETFIKEGDASCPATVSWEGQSGNWVATVQGKAAEPCLFCTAEYELGAETIVRNSAPVEMTHLFIGGVKYTIGTTVIEGKTVLTLTP